MVTVEILCDLIGLDAVAEVGEDDCRLVDKSYWHLGDVE